MVSQISCCLPSVDMLVFSPVFAEHWHMQALCWLRTPRTGGLDICSVPWSVLRALLFFLFGIFHSSNMMSLWRGSILCTTDAAVLSQWRGQLNTLCCLLLPVGLSGSHPSPGDSGHRWWFHFFTYCNSSWECLSLHPVYCGFKKQGFFFLFSCKQSAGRWFQHDFSCSAKPSQPTVPSACLLSLVFPGPLKHISFHLCAYHFVVARWLL